MTDVHDLVIKPLPGTRIPVILLCLMFLHPPLDKINHAGESTHAHIGTGGTIAQIKLEPLLGTATRTRGTAADIRQTAEQYWYATVEFSVLQYMLDPPVAESGRHRDGSRVELGCLAHHSPHDSSYMNIPILSTGVCVGYWTCSILQ